MSKKVALTITVDPELKKEIYDIAASEDKKVSAMVSRIIENGMHHDTDLIEAVYIIKLWETLSKDKKKNKQALELVKQIISLKGVNNG